MGMAMVIQTKTSTETVNGIIWIVLILLLALLLRAHKVLLVLVVGILMVIESP